SNTLTNFVWNAAMSVAHTNTSVETGKTVTISPTTSGGTGAVSTWAWGISQYFTGYAIGGITINSSGVIRVAGSVAPAIYTMVVSSADQAGAFYYNNVTITVSDIVAPSLSLSISSETVTVGNSITGFTVTNSGSSIDSFAINQTLPAGLTFSTATGLITGTPTETATSLVITLTASNFAGSDTATYTLTINAGGGGGSATITIALAGGALSANKGTAVNIIATISISGKVKFFANGKALPGCAAKSGSTSATCSWKPSIQGQIIALYAALNPTSNSYSNVRSSTLNVPVTRRTGLR
ncbi:MAG: putative Ig domain-containing protein, partial [Candidatus Planktophila sp.]